MVMKFVSSAKQNSMTAEVGSYLNSAREFLLELPLYRKLQFTRDVPEKTYNFIRCMEPVDAYCLSCKKDSTFVRANNDWDVVPFSAWEQRISGYLTRELRCTRSGHTYMVQFLKTADAITKIGQYPSIADLQFPFLQKYRRSLGEQYQELTKAVGLFANGIGIGSFVYLRRIFERLIEEARGL